MAEDQTAPDGTEPVNPTDAPPANEGAVTVPSQGNVINPPAGQEETHSPVSAQPPEVDQVVTDLNQQAAAQSPAEPQTVPEVRPQAFTGPAASQQSTTSQRVGAQAAHGAAEYAAAEPTAENEAAADAAGRSANFIPGQRVQIIGGDDIGRMALIQSVVYTDPVQEMISRMGGSESRFADVRSYIVLTRDGRSDTLVVTPENLQALETNNGWGRGTI